MTTRFHDQLSLANDSDERNRRNRNARVQQYNTDSITVEDICGGAVVMKDCGTLTCYCSVVHSVSAEQGKCCPTSCFECGAQLHWRGAENFTVVK